jgi:hypothetical protein
MREFSFRGVQKFDQQWIARAKLVYKHPWLARIVGSGDFQTHRPIAPLLPHVWCQPSSDSSERRDSPRQ